MGAYSNPEILVDTQSGQHWRNLQKDINSTFNKVTEDLTAIAKKNQEYGEQAKLNTKFARDLTSKMDVDNPNMNIQESLKPLVDEYERLQTDLAFGKSKNITEDRYKIQQIEQSIKKTQGMIENNLAFGKDYREKAANLGMVGGYSAFNDPAAMAIGAVSTNNAKGKIDLAFDLNTYEPSLIYYSKIKADDGTEGYSEIAKVDSKKMEAYAAEQGGLKVIPAATDLFESLRKNPTLFGAKGEILPDFQTKEKRVVKTETKETITNNKLDKNIERVNTRTFIVPNADLIKTNLEQNIDASIEGMDKIGDLTVFYNQYVDTKNPVPLNGELTPEQKKTTRDWISNSFIKTLPEAIEDKSEPEEVSYITKQTKTIPEGNTNVENNKQSAADKKLAEQSAEITKTMKELKQGQQRELKYDDRTIYYDGSKWTIPAVKDRAQVVLEFKKAAEHYLRTGIVDKSIK
jgi:hypothetical protein